MKSWSKCFWLLFLTLTASMVLQGTCRAETKFFVKAEPVSFLFSSKIDGFSANDGYIIETVNGSGSWLPMVMAGLEVNANPMVYSLAGGAGYLYNQAFNGAAISAEASARYKIGKLVEIGPHAVMLYFASPSWQGSTNIDLDSSIGFGGGLAFAVKIKSDTFKITGAIDYINGKFDVTCGPGVTASSNKLDYSGVMFKVGAQYCF